MSPLEVLQFIGYSTGAALHLWMAALLVKRRRGLGKVERVLLVLAVGMGVWHACNLVVSLHGLLGLERVRWEPLLRFSDTLAVVSITLSYSFLLHVHLHLWAVARGRALTLMEKARVYLSYAPALFLFTAVPHLWSGPYEPMLDRFEHAYVPFAAGVTYSLAFGLWAAYVLGLVAATDLLIARLSSTRGERRSLQTLAASLVAIGLLILAVYGFGLGQGTRLGLYLKTLANLGSLLPSALIAYYIYRYRYLELIIKESLIVATFAVVVLAGYLFGIRTFGEWLTARFNLRAGAVEALLILALALVAAPLRGWLERRFHRLFEREAALYRETVARINSHAGQYRKLPELLRFVEERTAQTLGLRRVRLVVRYENESKGAEGGHSEAANGGALPEPAEWIARVMNALRRQGWNPLEGERLLHERGYELAHALRREEQTVGLMLVDAADDALTPDGRAVLQVLAGQVAIAVEDSRLVEENVRLERQVAQGERLAALGQMAATVAHEVKNPLSAIKSIAQVMREDENVKREYERDLSLIVGETDRLSRNVTQLLSFARTSPSAVAPSHAAELVRAVVELFRAEASGRNIRIECRASIEGELDGPAASALRDALSNLLINAIQATPLGGHVTVEAQTKDEHLLITVTDSGPGIAPDLRERIWEPFFTTKQRGTGLGLAIVRKRMEEAGGFARLAATGEGQGARFELRVPLRGL
ncbi:MAG TPA: ATP-binding protein [Pyrinomonadaceae bacterium]|jgi:signal transduction histidine kinase